MKPNIQIVYSHVTLAEIRQIPKDEYMVEHIEVLAQLNAKYIEPLNKKLSNKRPIKVYIEYLKNLKSSYRTPHYNFSTTIDKFSRKISGLPIEESLVKLGENMTEDLKNIMSTSIEQINSLDENEHDEPMKSFISLMKKNLPTVLNSSLPTSNPFTEINNSPLGTKPFREHKPIKKLMKLDLSGSELVIAMEEIFNNEHSEVNWKPFIKDTIENKILIAYNLMNLAGYYADDFDKVKKGKDRFRASQNDMQHATHAHIASFLISNDKAFCKKTVASYEYANVKTIVCSTESFLKEHFLKRNQ